VSRRGITRRRLLAAAGTVLAAPGCLGGGAPAPPPEPARTQAARVTGPLRVLAPAGAVPAANTFAFRHGRSVDVDVRSAPPGPDLIALLASGYPADVLLARQDDVAVLGNLGLLRELDHDRIPNLGLVDSAYLDLGYDRKNRWSAPARYGVYGFGYRRGLVAGKAAAWADFFDLVHRYAQQGISFLPGPVEPIAAALAALDEDVNTDDDSALERAQALLLAARPEVNTFSADPVPRFGRGELVLAMGTAADFGRVRKQPGRAIDTTFVLPQGRSEMWIDGWVMPVAGRHPGTATQWIDLQLSPAAAARAWAASLVPAPERAAARLLPAAMRHDPLASIDPAVVDRYQLSAVTPAGLQKRAEIWRRVQAG
jgi:spermidine/putrescine transport system substrate-binding protein